MSELQDRLDDARVVADAVAYHGIPLPLPEIAQDSNDGDLLFEWRVSSKTLVMIWARDHHISYAGMLDGVGSHGRSEDLEVLPGGCLHLLLAVAARMNKP